MTKEEAAEQIGALTRDRDFIKRYLSGKHEATVKRKPLYDEAHFNFHNSGSGFGGARHFLIAVTLARL